MKKFKVEKSLQHFGANRSAWIPQATTDLPQTRLWT